MVCLANQAISLGNTLTEAFLTNLDFARLRLTALRASMRACLANGLL